MSMIEMTLIKAGTFIMGSPEYEDIIYADEIQHSVTLTKNFFIGKYTITQAQYKAVVGTNPSYFDGDHFPVEQVNWYDALVFCNMLSIQEHLMPCYTVKGSTEPNDWGDVPEDPTNLLWLGASCDLELEHYKNIDWNNAVCDWNANGYRLPTEAEWEYAARGGQSGEAEDLEPSNGTYVYPDELAWYYDNSEETTHQVGRKKPNSLGLYDMIGNVDEWCWDWFNEYESGAQTDPCGPVTDWTRTIRGGGWNTYAQYLRLGQRAPKEPTSRACNIGFRLVRPVV
jgi:formylglycine-generating enzyme required for sulfatase activity